MTIKSIDLILYWNEVTDFELTRELGKLFQAETDRLQKSFSNELAFECWSHDKRNVIYTVVY